MSAILKPSPPNASRRMGLASIRSGKIAKPDRIMVIGVEGVGKSTFGAEAPDPIFLSTESGTHHLDVSRFPEPESLADVHEAIAELTNTDHAYQTLVIDTLDWLEPIIWKAICARGQKPVDNIEEVGGGFGKGYTIAQGEFRSLMAKLETLQQRRGMSVILLAHVHVKNFSNPVGADYSRYQAAFNEKAYGVVKQWTDVVGFATFEETVDDSKGKAKGISSGRRVMHLERSAAWDAKNRLELPHTIPFSYADYAEARDAAAAGTGGPAPVDLVTDCIAKADALGFPQEHPSRAAIAANASDPAKLLRILNKLKTEAAQ